MVCGSGGKCVPQCKWCKWCMHVAITADGGGVKVCTPSVKGVNGVNGVRIMWGDDRWC